MSRKLCVSLLIVVCVLGSLVTFYGTNMLMSDLANMYYTSINQDIISSIPFFMFSLDFVLVTLFVSRLYRHHDQKRALAKLYTILLAVFSLVGAVCSVLAGIMVYGDLLAPYPFAAYPTVCLVLHAVLFVAAIALNVKARRLEPDSDKRRMTVKYVIYTAVLSLLIIFAYNRFGALLFAVCYAQARTLYLTWPFYVSLLLPISLFVYEAGFIVGWFEKRPRAVWVAPLVILLFDVVLGGAVIYLGSHYTQFISAISPALGLERIATMPIDTIVLFAGVALFSVYFAISAFLLSRKKAKKARMAEAAKAAGAAEAALSAE